MGGGGQDRPHPPPGTLVCERVELELGGYVGGQWGGEGVRGVRVSCWLEIRDDAGVAGLNLYGRIDWTDREDRQHVLM